MTEEFLDIYKMWFNPEIKVKEKEKHFKFFEKELEFIAEFLDPKTTNEEEHLAAFKTLGISTLLENKDSQIYRKDTKCFRPSFKCGRKEIK